MRYQRNVLWQKKWHIIVNSDAYVSYAACGQVFTNGRNAETASAIGEEEQCGNCRKAMVVAP